MLQLMLFITGNNHRSKRIIDCLRKMLDERSDIPYELTVCDVLLDPEAAEKAKVLATPTLLVLAPEPGRRMVGDLYEPMVLLPFLGLSPL